MLHLELQLQALQQQQSELTAAVAQAKVESRCQHLIGSQPKSASWAAGEPAYHLAGMTSTFHCMCAQALSYIAARAGSQLWLSQRRCISGALLILMPQPP
jgi:hypothetical protein